jgi:hypothetical protein
MHARLAFLVLAVCALGVVSTVLSRSSSGALAAKINACGKAPTALVVRVGLPPSIPKLRGVVFTRVSGKGSMVNVRGYWKSGNLREAMHTYTFGLRQAGYVATDATANTWGRVSFAKGRPAGYVDLRLWCAQRTMVLIAFHPVPKRA